MLGGVVQRNVSVDVRSYLSALILLGLLGLGSCGNPNVPLTRPPINEFRVSSPRPPRVDRTKPPKPTPTPFLGPSLGALTATFFRIPWISQPQSSSLVRITAQFLKIPLPPPPGLSGPSLKINPEQLKELENLDPRQLDPAQLEQLQQQVDPNVLQSLPQSLDPALLEKLNQVDPATREELLKQLQQEYLKTAPSQDP